MISFNVLRRAAAAASPSSSSSSFALSVLHEMAESLGSVTASDRLPPSVDASFAKSNSYLYASSSSPPRHQHHVLLCTCRLCRLKWPLEQQQQQLVQEAKTNDEKEKENEKKDMMLEMLRKVGGWGDDLSLESCDISITDAGLGGWCASGNPATMGMVRHVHDPSLHALPLRVPSAERSLAGFKNPATTLSIGQASLSKAQPSPSSSSSSCGGGTFCSIFDNVPLSAEDMAFFATHKQCPISKKAYDMPPSVLRSLLFDDALLPRWRLTSAAAASFDGSPPSSSSTTPPPVVVMDVSEPSGFTDVLLLTNPATRMRTIVGACAAAHAVGATAVVCYLRYEYKNIAKDLKASFAMYQKVLNPHRLPAGFTFDVVVGGGPPPSSAAGILLSLEGRVALATAKATLFEARPVVMAIAETFASLPSMVYLGLEGFVRSKSHLVSVYGGPAPSESSNRNRAVEIPFGKSSSASPPSLASVLLSTETSSLPEKDGDGAAEVVAAVVRRTKTAAATTTTETIVKRVVGRKDFSVPFDQLMDTLAADSIKMSSTNGVGAEDIFVTIKSISMLQK